MSICLQVILKDLVFLKVTYYHKKFINVGGAVEIQCSLNAEIKCNFSELKCRTGEKAVQVLRLRFR